MLVLTRHSQRVSELAAQSHGIVTFAELRDAGYSVAEIRTMVAKGHLHRVRRAVFAVGHLALGDDARRMAMVRCGGSGAALAAISAAACWKITHRFDHIVDVVVTSPRRPMRGVGFTVDRGLPSDAMTTYRGIPILTPTWSIATMATRVGAGELTRVLREASYRRRLDMVALARIAERDDRRPGVATLRKAIDLRTAGSAGYASRFEADVNRYVRSCAVIQPIPNALVDVEGDSLEVDMVWRSLRICAEIDGPIHDDPDVRRDDARRTALLEAAGWTVIRIHWTAWEADPATALAPLLMRLTSRS